ncbi:carbohydrate ABC transporter permease [Clostridium grantii]|uniref:Putative aldouronate transport system permease protein n=1 Tax=Clostridium grantii DSM 8605 TaxID=1121316 RepID=A0A1M5Y0K7_9CLOT|nr:carbohydrate ABC transporter permease [Clostridium grantii]SHI05479.1 putative aldouronate transport system permease protein [Clostridium grantii DSM 8605]
MAKSKNKKLIIESKGEKVFKIVNNILLIIIGILALYPLLYILSASLSKPAYVQSGDVLLLPKGFTVESYKQAFNTPGLWRAYGNTFYYTLAGTIVNLFFTTTGAYVLSKKRLVYRKAITMFVVITLWFNAGMIPFYLTLRDLHILNTRFAIIVGFAINTYNLIIMRTFFQSIPESLEEAAYIDGANNIKIFYNIYLPLSKPALATIGLFYTVTRWNGYFWAMNIFRDDDKVPLQVLLKKLIVEKTTNSEGVGLITQNSLYSPQTVIYAVIIIAVVPMIAAYPFIQKYFKKGVMIGSVKG